MKNSILNKENRKYAKKCLDKIIEMGIDFKLQDDFRKKQISEEEINKLYNMPLGQKSMEDIIKVMKEEILPYCSNFATTKFMGFPDAGNSIAGISGAVLSDFLQQNLINSSFCAPIATYMEIAVIKWLREIVGYKKIK